MEFTEKVGSVAEYRCIDRSKKYDLTIKSDFNEVRSVL